MKFMLLMLCGVFFGLLELFLFFVAEKTQNNCLSISSYVVSIIFMFFATIGTLYLGKSWNMEKTAKYIMGISCALVIVITLLYSQNRK